MFDVTKLSSRITQEEQPPDNLRKKTLSIIQTYRETGFRPPLHLAAV